MRPGETTWTAEMDAGLAARWLAGESGTEIGKAMGKSKNAIIGRVHRIGLPSRPSPIRGNGVERPKVVPLPSMARPVLVVVPAVAVAAVVVPPRPKVSRPRPGMTCQYIHGDTRATYRFCGAPVGQHRSWCAEHYRKVFTRSAELFEAAD